MLFNIATAAFALIVGYFLTINFVTSGEDATLWYSFLTFIIGLILAVATLGSDTEGLGTFTLLTFFTGSALAGGLCFLFFLIDGDALRNKRTPAFYENACIEYAKKNGYSSYLIINTLKDGVKYCNLSSGSADQVGKTLRYHTRDGSFEELPFNPLAK